jgi:hypothetical protein
MKLFKRDKSPLKVDLVIKPQVPDYLERVNQQGKVDRIINDRKYTMTSPSNLQIVHETESPARTRKITPKNGSRQNIEIKISHVSHLPEIKGHSSMY